MQAVIRDALDGAERIRRIVTDMSLASRSASQSGDSPLSAVRVADALKVALKMAQPLTRVRAQVHSRVDEALPPVVADERRLVQVLLNLVVNAAQAIPEGRAADHEIVVEARAHDGRVIVEVRDTGSGIPP